MEDVPDLPALLPGVTYLREVAIEGQELYTELRYAGFTDRQATAIVAYMVTDAVNSRDEEYYDVELVDSEDDDEYPDDEDDLYDNGDGS